MSKETESPEEVVVEDDITYLADKIIITNNNGRVGLEAKTGYILTNGVVRGLKVALSNNDSIDNWSVVAYDGMQDSHISKNVTDMNNDRLTMMNELSEVKEDLGMYKEIVRTMLDDGGGE